MARLTELPSIDIIRGFKGVLDFYLWKGLPCVRKWPRTPKSRQTEATKAAALLFGQVLKNYSLLADLVLVAYQEIAAGTPRTARDVYVSGAYGRLHEASMSDFLTLLTNCRDSLLALEALLGALHDVGADELDVHVQWSALPAGAAAAAHQVTEITALQKIDDLQDALESKALDRLIVRGQDQLFSFDQPLATRTTAAISGAGGFIDSVSPGAGIIWVVTGAIACDLTSPTTQIRMLNTTALPGGMFYLETRAFGVADWAQYNGHQYLEEGDSIRAHFTGALEGDSCRIELTGYQMTEET